MIFRTIVDIIPSENKINHRSKIMMIGSCFTTYIGERLSCLKYMVDINPAGTSFNPVSAANCLEILLNRKMFTMSDIEYSNDRWISNDHHSDFSSPDAGECLQKINTRITGSADFLGVADFLFITFGTAWVFEEKKTGKIVSNCHKKSASEFLRRLLTTGEIVDLFKLLIEKIHKINPAVKFVFTVSPIRHLADGVRQNQVSKSTLILAANQLIKLFENSNIISGYFPSYEIMMDDLRDYRFYSDDMVHPSSSAIQYIWKQFEAGFISTSSAELHKELERINKAISHIPFNCDSDGYQLFARSNIENLVALQKKYDYLDFSAEIEYFRNKIRQIENTTG